MRYRRSTLERLVDFGHFLLVLVAFAVVAVPLAIIHALYMAWPFWLSLFLADIAPPMPDTFFVEVGPGWMEIFIFVLGVFGTFLWLQYLGVFEEEDDDL